MVERFLRSLNNEMYGRIIFMTFKKQPVLNTYLESYLLSFGQQPYEHQNKYLSWPPLDGLL